MSALEETAQRGVVRILGSNDVSVGTGFVVDRHGLIVTCAHVVRCSGASPGGLIRAELHDGTIVQARVRPDLWRGRDQEDVAFLKLQGTTDFPSPLKLSTSEVYARQPIRAFGYPAATRVRGMWANGVLGGSTRTQSGHHVIQISSTTEITSGFSGAPVLVGQAMIAVGMITFISERDANGRLGETAFFVPMSVIKGICPDLDAPDPEGAQIGQCVDGLYQQASQGLSASTSTLLQAPVSELTESELAGLLGSGVLVSPVLSVTANGARTQPANVPRSETKVIDFHEAMQRHGGRIVLLGNAGAGKTTQLLRLAQESARDYLRDSTQPIPILTKIHSWRGTLPVIKWACSEIGLSPSIAKNRRFLFLFDGLDELASEDLQKMFLAEIASEISHHYVVISSRFEDYARLRKHQRVLAAVALLPLRDADIEVYLEKRGQTAVWSQLRSNESLLEMARNPLLLAILARCFEDAGSGESIGNLDEPSLLDRFVSLRFAHEAARPDGTEFDEPTTRGFLERAAVEMTDERWFRVELPQSDLQRVFGERAESFVEFAQRLHLVLWDQGVGVRFSHFLFQYFFAAPRLSARLNSADQREQTNSAHLLAHMGRIAVPSLLGQLGSKSPEVRTLVIRIILEMAFTGRAPKRTPPELLASVKDRAASVREALARLLGWIRDDTAVEALLKLLPDRVFLVRAAAAASLGAVGNPVATAGLIERLNPREVPRVICNAAKALAQRKDAAAIPHLIKLLGYRNFQGFLAIPAYLWPSILLYRLVARRLWLEELEGPEVVRAAAAAAIGDIGGDSGLAEHLHDTLNDSYAGVRKSAAEALGKLRNKVSISHLVKRLSDRDLTVRTFAAHALGQIGGEEAAAGLIEAISDKENLVQEGLREHWERDPAKDVYTQIRGALVSIGVTDVVRAGGVAKLLRLVEHSEALVRMDTAEILGLMLKQDGLDLLNRNQITETLNRLLDDTDYYVRLNAQIALGMKKVY